jgi:hypothetical protein
MAAVFPVGRHALTVLRMATIAIRLVWVILGIPEVVEMGTRPTRLTDRLTEPTEKPR